MSLYDHYGSYKNYTTPQVGAKHIRKFDNDVWEPLACQSDMSFLEIGCGTGLFMLYLHSKNVVSYCGLDQDEELEQVVPTEVKDHFQCADIWDYLTDADTSSTYDRIVLFDVMEHFTAEDGIKLLKLLAVRLNPSGKILFKTPNAASPWGLQFQHGDLTHKTAFTPDSMRQLAVASGYICEKFYPHYLGSPSRQRKDRVFHWLVSQFIATPPEIWTANFYSILSLNIR